MVCDVGERLHVTSRRALACLQKEETGRGLANGELPGDWKSLAEPASSRSAALGWVSDYALLKSGEQMPGKEKRFIGPVGSWFNRSKNGDFFAKKWFCVF